MTIREQITTFFERNRDVLYTQTKELLERMRFPLSGDTYRFRPVFWSLFFFLVVCCVVPSAGAATPCGITKNDCPACPAGGLSLTSSNAFDNNPTGSYDDTNPFAGLTCIYGNPLSGNTVTVQVECYQDGSVAQKWYQYYKREIPYPYPESQYAPANPKSSYWESPVGHRNSAIRGADPDKVPTFTSAYADWDFAIAGRNVAKITSLTPTDTITQQQATAENVRRISQYAGCFASFGTSPVPSSPQKVIKGTITGSGMTREFYREIQAAMDDARYRDNPAGLTALLQRSASGFAPAKPLRHVKITWKGSQEAGAQDKEYITATDENGKFEIPAALVAGKQYEFDIEFTYRKADTDYFSVSDAGIYDVATWPHVFEYSGDDDLRQDIDFITELNEMKEDKEFVARVTSTLYLYDETANAFEFYADHLKEMLNCNLPLHVYPYQETERRTVFVIDAGTGKGKPAPAIIITPADSTFDNPVHSQYIVYHEFSHYAMYCIYDKKFPVSDADTAGALRTVNHGGYMNPSTSDSFTEGFAEFMPAVIADHYGNTLFGVSSGAGSIEDTFRAWEYEGRAEEHAVSTTLWNLFDTSSHYDSRRKAEEQVLRNILADPRSTALEAEHQKMTVTEYTAQLNQEIALLQSGGNTFDDEHPVKLQFGEIWAVLRTYNRDFTDVYNGFVSRYPGQKSGIDTVFAAHGFYRDTGKGNGTYDPGEAWRGASRDKATYTAGDPFIDYPVTGFTEYRISEPYQGTNPVGSASEYQRTTRRSSEPLPGHFIRTPVDVPLYVASVEYDDHPWRNYRTIVSSENNLVPVPVPPPGEHARVTVIPAKVTSGNPLSFTSEEFNRNFEDAAAHGYYAEHDFKVSGQIPVRTVVRAGTPSGTASRVPAGQTTKSAGSGGLFAVIVPVAAILALVLFVKKK